MSFWVFDAVEDGAAVAAVEEEDFIRVRARQSAMDVHVRQLELSI